MRVLKSAWSWLLPCTADRRVRARAGWYTPLTPPDISHLSFEAPVMTIIFLAVAGMVGGWNRQESFEEPTAEVFA